MTDHGLVQIVLLSLRRGTKASRTKGLQSAMSATALSRRVEQRLVLLPGAIDGWPDEAIVSEVLVDIDATILFEVAGGGWHVSAPATGDLGVEIHQQFATSAQVNAEPELIDAFLRDCRPGGERTLRLAGVDIGLLCCGENNVLVNAQADGNSVSVRHHPGEEIFEHVPIIFNGAHTNMGNWGKLDRRFEFLAKNERWTLFATNNASERDSWKSAVRVYFDGELVADGEAIHSTPRGVQIERVIDEEHDNFRALVLHVPGRMLKT